MNTKPNLDYKERISFQMTKDLKNKAFEKAKKENVNLSALIRSWLEEWVNNTTISTQPNKNN